MEQLIDISKTEIKIEKAKNKKERQQDDIRKLLSMPEGRRFIWRLLSFCRVFKESDQIETNIVFIEKGVRRVGIWIFNIILEAKPEAYAQMQREWASEIKSEENKEEKENNQRNILDITA